MKIKVTLNGSKSEFSKIKVVCPKFDTFSVNFSPCEIVQDEYRGVLLYRGKSWFFISMSQYKNCNDKKENKKIALVLESPHKDEFINGVPIRPANGKTGERIEAKISQKIEKWEFTKTRGFKNYDYFVYLINAVQYQCSCYKLLKECWAYEIKNCIFRMLFNKNKFDMRGDFVFRLKMLSPDYIVNCVTSNLKSLVKNAIKNDFDVEKKYCERSHPSVW